MKTRSTNQKFNLMPMSVFFALIFAGIISCTGQQDNKKVYEAYELRINGQADSARVVLEHLLSQDSTNAMAWFELCRTTEHIGMANPRGIHETLKSTLEMINQAIKYDPSNAYYISYKGSLETLHYYIALQTGDEKAGEYLDKLEQTYISVFTLDPFYYENKITLVEFFGGLPPDMGGNLEKAEKYAKELEEADLVSGAKAREILMPEDADYVSFWEEIIDEEPKNADAIQALGRVYLFMEDIDSGKKYYQKAIDIDPSKSVLYLDLGRYYLMTAMQNPDILDSVASLIEEQFNKFLNFSPEPVAPMKAWTYGTLSMINRHMENAEAAEKFLAKAKELDPFFSPKSGKPSMQLFCPPDVVLHEQSYYLSPF